MPTLPKVSLSTVIHLLIVVAFAGLLLYSHSLRKEIIVLQQNYTTISTVYNEKVDALNKCSTATLTFKKREDELTKNAKVAVDEAKKKAVVDYKAANSYLFRKPSDPVITPANAKEYGGEDTMIQLKDYLSTQQMVNEFIEVEVSK